MIQIPAAMGLVRMTSIFNGNHGYEFRVPEEKLVNGIFNNLMKNTTSLNVSAAEEISSYLNFFLYINPSRGKH